MLCAVHAGLLRTYRRYAPSPSTLQHIIVHAVELAFGNPEEQMQLLNAMEEEFRRAGHFLCVYRMTRAEMVQHMVAEEKRQHERKQRCAKREGSPAQTFNEEKAENK